jgi:tetratricopeptide (TPR) repeat protein
MTPADPAAPSVAARRPVAIQAAVIVLAGCWVYWPALHGGWVWDDPAEISQNAVLRDSGGLAQIWSGAAGVDYFPLKTTVQWVEWQIWGDHTAGYHAVNLGLHLLGAFLLWRLLCKLGVRWAWLGGLLFAVHPIAVESVAWISELKNTLSLPLLLGAMIAYVDYDDFRAAKGATSLSYIVSLLLFLLAMLSKSTVAMFPFVILLYAWWKRGFVDRRDLLASAPFLAASLSLGAVTVWFQHARAIAGVPLGLGGIPSRVAGAGLAAAFYLEKCVFPMDLMPIYPRWVVDPPSPVQFLPWLAFAIILGWLWTRRASWGRPALLGLGWFLLNLVPVLGLIPMAYQRISWVADHLAYLSLAGATGLAAAGAGALQSRAFPGRSWPILAAAGVVSILFAVESHRYAGIFRDEETLWNAALERNPGAWMAQNNLGKALFLRGRMTEAAVRFKRALENNPSDAEAHFNLGLVFEGEGREAEAMAEDETALRLRPAFPEAKNSLGNGFLRTGRPDVAIDAYEAALRLRPDYAEAHANLGAALIATGALPRAAVELERAIELRPDFPEAHFNLGNVLSRTGRSREAIAEYGLALSYRPGYAEARNSLGVALAAAGRMPEALAEYERAIQLKPDYAEAHFNLGNALAQAGRVADAIPEYEAAIRGEPDSPEAHNNLGIVLAESGRLEKAGAQFREALRLKPDYPQARENLSRIEAGR